MSEISKNTTNNERIDSHIKKEAGTLFKGMGMAFSFDCAVITHIGKRRKSNEDNFLASEMLMPEEQAAMSKVTCRSVSADLFSILVSSTELGDIFLYRSTNGINFDLINHTSAVW